MAALLLLVQTDPAPLPPVLVALFPVGFVLFWLGISFLISRVAWSRLASAYPGDPRFEGRRWHMTSAQIGLAGYGSSLTVGASEKGFYLRPILPFRFGHSPILIPWTEITAEWKEGFGFKNVRFTVRRVPDATILLPEQIVREIMREAGNAWFLPEMAKELETRAESVDLGRTIAVYAALAVFIFVLAGGGLGSLNGPRYWKLDRYGQTIEAKVTSVEPMNHNRVRFAYTVGNETFTGSGSISDAHVIPLEPGAILNIHYLPAQPAVSCLGDPRALFDNEVAFALTGGIMLALMIVFVLRNSGFAIRS